MLHVYGCLDRPVSRSDTGTSPCSDPGDSGCDPAPPPGGAPGDPGGPPGPHGGGGRAPPKTSAATAAGAPLPTAASAPAATDTRVIGPMTCPSRSTDSPDGEARAGHRRPQP